ncbi:hypothetical protein THAOC_15828 [Thalassiosira oceanica]|uniref:Uncharacterized protein n=1 Tax=Thalassiosira oceanica TaxID=159749 RepID=K0SDN2_THAOC|nr:hypothetical protein THAOC_15828 [Thalassiosira oceanica]|eukprot:EJK63505.1 hypothetical protein THAOC_15828 [Thalassiosira oceanica]
MHVAVVSGSSVHPLQMMADCMQATAVVVGTWHLSACLTNKQAETSLQGSEEAAHLLRSRVIMCHDFSLYRYLAATQGYTSLTLRYSTSLVGLCTPTKRKLVPRRRVAIV